MDLVTKKFGKLTVLEIVSKPKAKSQWKYRCRCECGTETVVRAFDLKSGHTRSCGCLQRKHEMVNTPEYRSWIAMNSRCRNHNHRAWAHYGGRGIVVCDRWQESFENFLRDMGPRPSEDHSIERLNVNGNYEPGNCVWATPKEQANNTTTNIVVRYKDRTYTAMQLVELEGTVDYATFIARLHRGLSVEEALQPGRAKSRCQNSTRYDYRGQSLSLRELSELTGQPYSLLYSRLVKMGLSVEDAVHLHDAGVRRLRLAQYEYQGKRYTLPELSHVTGVPYAWLWRRCTLLKMPVEEAIKAFEGSPHSTGIISSKNNSDT